eukprot:TRINITY_DN2705_c0_g1_i1.p1 TRINITY_DN2705_c0_g1~~TRINITY_DN2705_c0_g1_i1.p1  ORF type:complete len:344 (-),score=49.97 TRINITY_DN2705_c0_g1_i1:320-1270(-)
MPERRVQLVTGASDDSDWDEHVQSCELEYEPWYEVTISTRGLIFAAGLSFAVVFGAGVAAIMASKPPAAAVSAAAPVEFNEQRKASMAAQPELRGTLAQASLGGARVSAVEQPMSGSTSVQALTVSATDEPGAAPAVENMRRHPTAANLRPSEDRRDGNVCDKTEELFGGLCYTKCSILTGIPESRRSTAFSCCPTSDCHGNVFKMKTASLLPCGGYDVSSQDGGKACPHLRGECLTDEEQFLGKCFEKCTLLTDGRFPKRISETSCCNPEGTGGCWNFLNDDTDETQLDVGGGMGDGDKFTPRKSHFPLQYLTEK